VDRFEIGIIGAGIHGASAAFHLARRGVPAVVLDKETPGSGPTRRSSGICRATYRNEYLASAAREGIEFLAEFAEHTGGRDAGFHRIGLVYLHPAEDAADLSRLVPRWRDLGIDAELLSIGEIRSRYPWFELDGIEAGVWEPEAGYADPVLAAKGLLERAVELGTELRTSSRVMAIRPRAAGGATVEIADRTPIECTRLLIAAGPWSAFLARMIGVELPLTVERHPVAALSRGDGPWPEFGHVDVAGGYYSRPDGEDRLLVASLLPAADPGPDPFREFIEERESRDLALSLARRVPGLAGAARGGWAGLYDISPDWQPVIGEIADGVVVDAGSSGHGFKLAPSLGRRVADLLTGEPADPGLAQFHPDRFAAGRELVGGFGDARILG
jgi:glycine/D-amino acid oxidase-like deaminating enzyme